MSGPEIEFTLRGPFFDADGAIVAEGRHTAKADGAATFRPASADSIFTLHNVTIGKQFHWERNEEQSFRGTLVLTPVEGMLEAVNIVDVETYLESVISSEMSPTAGLEFLKAHAVISRSWVFAQLARDSRQRAAVAGTSTDEETVRWYDRSSHSRYQFCADDHCQRYQGVGRQTCSRAVEAVRSTRGQVLLDCDGRVCDARFSKCCGGAMEVFSTCWDDTDYHYLQARSDSRHPDQLPDLTNEVEAVKWIEGRPDAFCRDVPEDVLSQVLNSYDQETTDYYRWTECIDVGRLSEIVREKSGIDFGTITGLTPLRRGKSGRISRLLVTGTRRSMVVGKELEIRRWLSESHLKSSAFTTRFSPDGATVELHGAGWGHGVGLCQIGAANMGAQGYGYLDILQHYYPGSHVGKHY